MATPDRRNSRRAVLRQSCEVVFPGSAPRQGYTCELGLDGLSLLTSRPMAPGLRCQVRFELPAAAGPVPLTLPAKTVYSSFQGTQGFRIGVHFDRLTDEDQRILAGFLRGLG